MKQIGKNGKRKLTKNTKILNNYEGYNLTPYNNTKKIITLLKN